jgi:hypothetical protein
MPFSSARQELFMMLNMPKMHKEWVRRYGHHPDFKRLVRINRRKKTTSGKKPSKRKRGYS